VETSHSSSDLSDHSVGVADLNDLQARPGLLLNIVALTIAGFIAALSIPI
jgi:hypothetical protein